MINQLTDQLHLMLNGIIAMLPTLLKVIALLIIGFWIIKRIDIGLRKYFDRKNFDVSLEGFIIKNQNNEFNNITDIDKFNNEFFVKLKNASQLHQ